MQYHDILHSKPSIHAVHDKSVRFTESPSKN